MGMRFFGVRGNFTGELDVRNRDPVLTHPTSPPLDCNNATEINFNTHLVSPCIHSDSPEVWK